MDTSSPYLFGCLPPDVERREKAAAYLKKLYADLEEARHRCPEGRLVVVDRRKLGSVVPENGTYAVSEVPPEALINLEPYRRPHVVPAAGGVLLRGMPPEVLLIYRRGHWDLPKGKLKPGESPEEAALREVREELGIQQVRLGERAGVTWHAYPQGDALILKPTYWFFMETPARHFRPAAEEGITRVAWVPLQEAPRRVDYPNLRELLQALYPVRGGCG